MVVEQEMASIYPPEADDLSYYLPEIDCSACGSDNCLAFAEALLSKKRIPHNCPELPADFAELMSLILQLNMDPIPYNLMMEQTECQLIPIGSPGSNSPLLITCNFRATVTIMQTILEQTATNAYLLPIFTHGYSVDNAVHEKMFKAIDVWKSMQQNGVETIVDHRTIIIPGLAESQKNAIRQLTRWEVAVGPISGFLLPLFMSKIKHSLHPIPNRPG